MGVFFFGMGYSSQATARAIHDIVDGDMEIFGTTRSRPKAEGLIRAGIRSHAFDGRAPGLMLANDLIRAKKVIVSIPPGNDGDPVLAHHKKELDKAGVIWSGCATFQRSGFMETRMAPGSTKPRPARQKTSARGSA